MSHPSEELKKIKIEKRAVDLVIKQSLCNCAETGFIRAMEVKASKKLRIFTG